MRSLKSLTLVPYVDVGREKLNSKKENMNGLPPQGIFNTIFIDSSEAVCF